MARIEIIDKFEGLSAYEQEWNKLALECGQDWPMLTYAWVVSYLENMLAADEKWYCLLASDDSGLTGILPVIKKMDDPRAKLRLPLYSDVIIRKGFEKETLPLLLGSLKEIDRRWRGLSIYNIRKDSALHGPGNLDKAPVRFICDSDGFGSFSSLRGDFDSFMATLSSHHLRNLKKAARKLEYLNNPRFLFLEGAQADPKYLETFIDLEASGYKSKSRKGGSAIKTSPQRVAFKKALIKRFYDLNCLQWHILEADDKAIAVNMVWKIGRTLTLYKISYDEEFSALAPGKLLAQEMFRHAYSSGLVSGIDWITDLPFQDLWNVEKHPYYVYHIYPQGLGTYFREYLPRLIWTSLRDSKYLGSSLRKLRSLLGGGRR